MEVNIDIISMAHDGTESRIGNTVFIMVARSACAYFLSYNMCVKKRTTFFFDQLSRVADVALDAIFTWFACLFCSVCVIDICRNPSSGAAAKVPPLLLLVEAVS